MNQTTVPMGEQESKYITKLARKQLSRIGFVYLAGTVLLLALELSLVRLFQFGNPAGGYDSSVLTFCNLFLRFVLGYPLMLCLIHLVKKGKPISEKKMNAFFMSYAMAMIANIIGLLLTSIINAFHEGVNITDLQETMLALPSVWLILFVCVGAPVFEELIFRKALIDRAIYCGEGIAIAMSGVMFGLFHGNLNQFSYAFLLGLLLAYVYYRTGLLRVSVALHMVLNFFGAVVSLLLPDCAASDMALGAFWMVSVVLGVILLVRGRKDQIWLHGPCAPDMRAVFGNAGMILVIAGCFVETALTF